MRDKIYEKIIRKYGDKEKDYILKEITMFIQNNKVDIESLKLMEKQIHL